MTTIILDTYGTTASGIKRYLTNRLLRIYPSYLTAFLVFSVVFLFFSRAELMTFDANISTPGTLLGWFQNLTLIGLDFSIADRTIPPSWTLFVELAYYALIPVLLLIHPRVLLLWLCLAISYHAYWIAQASTGDPSMAWESRYGTVAAGALGFAIGACSRVYLPGFLKTRTVFLVSLLLFSGCYILAAYWALSGMRPEIQRLLSTVGYYGVMITAAPVVDYLARMPKNKLSEHFGEYSYPFYLLHIPVGFLAFASLDASHKSIVTLAAGILASLATSSILIKLDRRISVLRARLRSRSVTQKRRSSVSGPLQSPD